MKEKEYEGYYQRLHRLSRVIHAKRDPEYTDIADYISERAWYSFKPSADGLERGQLRTSIRQLAEERGINRMKVSRIMKFLRAIGFVNCEDEMAGDRKAGILITLPFYDVEKKASVTSSVTSIPEEKEKKCDIKCDMPVTSSVTSGVTSEIRGAAAEGVTSSVTSSVTLNKEKKGFKKGLKNPPSIPPKMEADKNTSTDRTFNAQIQTAKNLLTRKQAELIIMEEILAAGELKGQRLNKLQREAKTAAFNIAGMERSIREAEDGKPITAKNKILENVKSMSRKADIKKPAKDPDAEIWEDAEAVKKKEKPKTTGFKPHERTEKMKEL